MTNRMKDAFDSVHTDASIKEDTRAFLRTKRKPQVYWKPLLSCVALVFVCAGIYVHIAKSAIAYISVDINPSLELTLNRFDHVIVAQAWNEDGEELLADVNLNGLYYLDAIDTLVESDALQPYLTENSELTFTVASKNSSKESALLQGLNTCRLKAQCYTADPESLSQAHHCGMSFGKYNAYLTLLQYDDSVRIEDCQDMSMAQIHQRIRACEGNKKDHNANGHGHQHGKE